MKKEKLLWVLIIVLIAVNAATLFFIVSGRRPEPGNRFDRTVVEKLQLTKKQITQFEILKREHHQDIMAVDAQMSSNYERYFYLLNETNGSTAKDSLEIILSSQQKEKIQITYHHFENLKNICTKEQQAKFKELVPLLMHVITPQKNPRQSRRN